MAQSDGSALMFPGTTKAPLAFLPTPEGAPFPSDVAEMGNAGEAGEP